MAKYVSIKILNGLLFIFKSDDETNRIFVYLHSINAIMVDKTVLDLFYQKPKQTYDIKELSDSDNHQTQNFTFALYENDFKIDLIDTMKDDLTSKYKLNCTITSGKSNGFHISNKTTNMYVKCNFTRIQIAVMYKRGNFYWIGDDSNKDMNKPRWFGDTPRSLNW